MKFKQFNNQEREAYKRGKIAGYYSRKAHERRQAKSAPSASCCGKYNTFSGDDAFQRALMRSYGKK